MTKNACTLYKQFKYQESRCFLAPQPSNTHQHPLKKVHNFATEISPNRVKSFSENVKQYSIVASLTNSLKKGAGQIPWPSSGTVQTLPHHKIFCSTTHPFLDYRMLNTVGAFLNSTGQGIETFSEDLAWVSWFFSSLDSTYWDTECMLTEGYQHLT